MARWNSTGWILALVAILAILAGNLNTVIGKRELVDSLQKITNFGTDDTDGSPGGSWNILNLINAPVTVFCRNQKLIPSETVVLNFNEVWAWQFGATTYEQIFDCRFNWAGTGSGSQTQDFTIWEQDDPVSFLYSCTACFWRILPDGFYLGQNDGSFVKEYEWNNA